MSHVSLIINTVAEMSLPWAPQRKIHCPWSIARYLAVVQIVCLLHVKQQQPKFKTDVFFTQFSVVTFV